VNLHNGISSLDSVASQLAGCKIEAAREKIEKSGIEQKETKTAKPEY
jgi:hypothetical protein